jgi:hypothetical protein
VISVHGWCALKFAKLTALTASGQEDKILDAHGDFVVLVRERRYDTVIMSRSGVVNYFYANGPLGIAHGSDVAEVANAAGMAWAWDYEAVSDYLRLGHPLGKATLHAAVRRFAAGTITRITRSGDVTTTGRPTGSQRPNVMAHGHVAPRDATAELAEAVAATERDCMVSMSGGLDSRVLLAASLHLGRRPSLIVSGMPGSFDRAVATAIATRFKLPVTVVQADAAAVAAGAAQIARSSGGLLPITNWAGHEHLRSARPALAGPVLHGANGEFARSFYAPDRGLASLSITAKTGPWLPNLLGQRIREPFDESETRLLCPPLRAALRPERFAERLTATTASLGGRTALDIADEFFLCEYGRQKTSADLAAIGKVASWRTPFFAAGWTRVVRALPRRWKLGSALHRRMIDELFPALLQFPEEGYRGSALSRRPHWRYWLSGPDPGSAPHYLDQAIFRKGQLIELFSKYRDAADDLFAPELLDRLADEQTTSGTRPHQAFGLLALAMFRSQTL